MFLKILDQLMADKKINKSILAKESGIPYTTIDYFYKKGYDNVKLSTLVKLSDYFQVPIDYLVTGNITNVSDHEKRLILSYRNHPEIQHAVDLLLGLSDTSED